MTVQKLKNEMNDALTIPGVSNSFTMPIKARIDMLATGIRTPIGMKVLGPKLEETEKLGMEIEKRLKVIPGTRSVYADRLSTGYFLDIQVQREEASRYGLTVDDVQEVIQSAIGGTNITTTIEGRERYPGNIRYPRDLRGDLDVGSYIAEATKKLASLKIPEGYRLQWSGDYEYLLATWDTLKIVLPLTVLIIILLFYLNTHSIAKTLIVLLAVPFSLIGSFWLLYFLDYNLSVAVIVGLIALAGLDAETGIVMLLYLDLAYAKWQKEGRLGSREALKEAT